MLHFSLHLCLRAKILPSEIMLRSLTVLSAGRGRNDSLVKRIKSAPPAKLCRFIPVRGSRITLPRYSGATLAVASPLVARPAFCHGADASSAVVVGLPASFLMVMRVSRGSPAACSPAVSLAPVVHWIIFSVCILLCSSAPCLGCCRLSLVMLAPVHGQKSSMERTPSNTDGLRL